MEHRLIWIFQFLKNFVDLSCFLVRAFKTSAFESILGKGFPTSVRKHSIFSYQCFAVLIPNVGFNLVFKPVAINLEYSSLFNSVVWFWLIVSCHAKIIRPNHIIESSYSDEYVSLNIYTDGSGTNRSEVPLQTRWASLRRFSILEA